MRLIFILTTCIVCLSGCEKQEQIQYNSMILRGKEGRLWLINSSEDENSKYLWFEQYGRCQVIEFRIDKVPNLVIQDEQFPTKTDSCVTSSVLLDKLPYKMIQCDIGLIYAGEIDEEVSIQVPFTSDDEYNKYLELQRKYKVLRRTFVPDKDNYEWYREWTAEYYPRTGQMWWFLSKTFIPDDEHPLNGRWQSLADSLILINEQSYRMIERKLWRDEDLAFTWSLSDRELILYNVSTNDSIRLLDAYCPPNVNVELYSNGYEKWIKKWGKSIQSSVLLRGEKYKLYQSIYQDDESPWEYAYIYFDDSGIRTSFFRADDGAFSNTIADDLDWATLWYQQGNTIIDKQGYKMIITKVLSSGDTIVLKDENGKEFLYIDTKLPSLRKKK